MTMYDYFADGIREYQEIQQEKWDEDHAPYGCDLCCGGAAIPASTSYWDMKERRETHVRVRL